MANDPTEIDYAAEVAADEAEASSSATLVQVVRDNLRHFEGFAKARAKQRKAMAKIGEMTQRKPDSLRRTFLDVYGPWGAFSRRVRADGPNVSPATLSVDLPPVSPGSKAGKVWE